MNYKKQYAARRIVQDTVNLHVVFGEGKVLCPWHEDRNPSLQIYDDHVHCFSCGAHADGVGYLIKRDGIRMSAAIRYLWRYRGAKKRREVAEFSEHMPTAKKYHNRLMAWEGDEGRDYLRRRGLLPSTIASPLLMLGWTGRGISIPHLGEHKAWNVKVRPLEEYRMDGEPKYKYLTSYKPPFLYPWDAYNAIFPDSNTLYLVEGEFDALILLQAGIPALAISGASNKLYKWWQFLGKMGHIYLAFDQDDAGNSAAWHVLHGKVDQNVGTGRWSCPTNVTRETWRSSWGIDVTDARRRLVPKLLRRQRNSSLSLWSRSST